MSQGRTNPGKPNRTPSTAAPRNAAPESGAFTLGAWWRRGISLLLVAHLMLVISVPLVAMPPRSLLATAITRWVAPYLDITQLSHGYGFFAAEPGPSHLVEYQLEFAPKDGASQKPVIGQFPDIKTQRPRLRYHRYFMLSEKLASFLPPQPEPPQRPTEEMLRSEAQAAMWQMRQNEYQNDMQDWRRQYKLFEMLVKSYGQHLMAENGASAIQMQIVTHMTPTHDAVNEGIRLNDPRNYIVAPGSESRVAIDEPAAGTEPQPEEIGGPAVQERSVAIPGERR